MSLTVFDIEVDSKGKIKDYGAIKKNLNDIHTSNFSDFYNFIQSSTYLSGHNIINHDIPYLEKNHSTFIKNRFKLIDTLYLSPLLFPEQPYHALVKDDKLQSNDINNPRNDAITTYNLLNDEVDAFHLLDEEIQCIYYLLLKHSEYFKSFFEYIEYQSGREDLIELIQKRFLDKICINANLLKIIEKYPIELAYSLSIIRTQNKNSNIPPWVLKNFPQVNEVLGSLRNNPCDNNCPYCESKFNAVQALKQYFKYDTFRKYNNEPLQENAVNLALHNKSLLAIFPTGGGKSITFQLPALVAGETIRGLTVVISPLQSLMKDQVDNLEKLGITDAITINGLIDPIERGKAFERIENGEASILYLSPESLRSESIERLLLGRKITRFVVDEAHCFSSWGHDFRIDYLYIAPFIKKIQDKKQLKLPIQVSCFTATAKLDVITDIKDYFKRELNLDLEIISTNTARKNLSYKVFKTKDDNEKYSILRNIIIEKNCPTIIYVSRTSKTNQIAEKLTNDGFVAKTYHGKMDNADKIANQNAFINGDVQIIVATSAFGMGVDKKDVKLVVHYEISGSLENYVQEAGRAGRDESIHAECFILYNEEDLNKHFILFNQTKLTLKEIKQIWKAIKQLSKNKNKFSNSALEIAREAGWDDTVSEIETRVKTAISALEQSKYLKRGNNYPRVYANSILTPNVNDAIEIINNSNQFNEHQKTIAIRIIKKLVSQKKSKEITNEVSETRVDYISDSLGIVKGQVIEVITLLREVRILGDNKDIKAFLYQEDSQNKSLKILKEFILIEKFLISYLNNKEILINLKSINEDGALNNIHFISMPKIQLILNYWQIKNWIKKHAYKSHTNEYKITLIEEISRMHAYFEDRVEVASFIIKYLYNKKNDSNFDKQSFQIDFSVIELLTEFNKTNALFAKSVSAKQIEEALFFLSKIGAVKLEGGFLVIYNSLTLERVETNNSIQFKNDDYKSLEDFYKNKVQQIHIVGEYANKMIENYESALRFVNDYFEMEYPKFLKKYFPNNRVNEISKTITPEKFKKIIGGLSPNQLEIVNDSISSNIVVGAGPGSGKTRVLVHKLASLLLLEDIKHEQLLMLTFSRAAVNEFKSRLIDLIGNAIGYIDIKTFHSFCFDLLGKLGDVKKSDTIIVDAIKKIKEGDVEANKITKTIIVVDEAQDMDVHEYELLQLLVKNNEDIRVLLVGDDDQNIYTFRGSDSKYFISFLQSENSKKYELLDNYRSKENLVQFSNKFVRLLSERFKTNEVNPIRRERGNLKITKHSSNHLVFPVVKDVYVNNYSGTTAILTNSNEEALNVYGFLIRNKMPAKLIQSNEKVRLFDLLEIRDFYNDIFKQKSEAYISNAVWKNAVSNFDDKHNSSIYFDVCKLLIRNYEVVNPRIKYISDFQNFLCESQLGDFVMPNEEKIIVSTIHKSKGKEFDNVFILLKDYTLSNDEKIRQLYVGLTRAKNNLHIHCNNSIFDDLEQYHYKMDINHEIFYNLKYIDIHISFTDVDLGFYGFVQKKINHLNSGDKLYISEDLRYLQNSKGENIVKFSNAYFEKILQKNEKGLLLSFASVLMIVYYTINKGLPNEAEIKIVIPQLTFENKNVLNEKLIRD